MSALEAPEPEAAALAIQDVEIVYRVRGNDREVVRGINLEIGKQQSYGLVGESGCGKSTAALSIVRYLPPVFVFTRMPRLAAVRRLGGAPVSFPVPATGSATATATAPAAK